MKQINKILLSIICMLSIILTDSVCVFAEKNTEAQTAAKTVRVSENDETEEAGNGEGTKGETDDKEDGSEEDEAEEADGASEKTGNYSIERMDITEMTEIRVSNYDEWENLAKKCTLDTWSADKYVVLTADIDCNMQKFTPIPYFAGVFDGGGHMINRAAFTEEENYIGVFSKTAPEAVIRNVNVIGVMKPAGKPFTIGGIVGDNSGMIADCRYDGYVDGYDYIGGIAGYNEDTGIISGCYVTGKITGLHYVGGICGGNAGLVTACSAKADVNTVTKDVDTQLSDIKVEEMFTSLINLGKEDGNKKSIASTTNQVDIGGIVGHNTGEISSCVSDSTVGYEHVGYNIGGIAGRQSGYVHDCTNNGRVCGRKDVGGIVGQAEPYIRLDLSSDVISQISNAIGKLHDSIDVTIKDTDSSSTVVSARLNVIKDFADRALGDTGYLSNSTQDFVNDVAGATNEIVGRMEYVLDEAAKDDGPIQDLADAGSNLKDATGDLEKMAEDFDIYSFMDEPEKEHYDGAKKNLKDRTKEFTEWNKSKYDEVYPSWYDRKYYQALKGDADPPAERPTPEEIAEAEEGKSEEEIEEAKAKGAAGAALESEKEADRYANEKYTGKYETLFAEDAKSYSETIAETVLNHSDEMTEKARADGKEAISDIKGMAGGIKDAGSRLRGIIGDVASRSDVRFPQLSEEYRMHANSLVANIQGMSDNLGLLNNEMAGSTDTMCADLEGVNDQFSTLMLLFTDAIDGALDMDYSEVFEDVSNDVCEDSIDATITLCANNGSVYADINTGGIAGTMAQEYDFDLEGDITGVKDAAKKSTYRTKCVLRDDINKGEVEGRKSYAGGACGLHEIGTILRCQNYSKVSSETSDYVGGIAGRSYSTIRQSYEKSVLAGDSYVGGIAGECVDIFDCVSMPVITKSRDYSGAVAGFADDDGKLSGNIFVSDDLAGVDRISMSGKAEPVDYKTLMATEGIPHEFSVMTVSFIVDDKVVATVERNAGGVVSPADTPMETEIATKDKKKDEKPDDKVVLEEDEYIDWDCDEEIPVYADMEIEGEIIRYASTLASEQTRENKQSIFLVDGRFSKDARLVISSIPAAGTLTEEFVIAIPDDKSVSHKIRYQKDPEARSVRILVKSGNEYSEVPCGQFGNYITFEAPGNEVVVRVVEEDKTDYRCWFILGGAALALIVIIVILVRVLKKKGRAKSGKKNKAVAEEADVEVEDIESDASTDLPSEYTDDIKPDDKNAD